MVNELFFFRKNDIMLLFGTGGVERSLFPEESLKTFCLCFGGILHQDFR